MLVDKALKVIILLAGLSLTVFVFVSANTAGSSIVYDVSWPNCNAASGFVSDFGIVGVNDGLAHTSSPCLFKETSWFSNYALYLNTGFGRSSFGPSIDNISLAYEYGYNAALSSLHYADLNNVHSRVWFLDVETANSWSSGSLVNQADIEGMEAAIQHTVFLPIVGIYSTPNSWQIITGDWQNGQPAWLGTGATESSIAQADCSNYSFNGGPLQLTQYTTVYSPKNSVLLDQDYRCSGQFLNDLD